MNKYLKKKLKLFGYLKENFFSQTKLILSKFFKLIVMFSKKKLTWMHLNSFNKRFTQSTPEIRSMLKAYKILEPISMSILFNLPDNQTRSGLNLFPVRYSQLGRLIAPGRAAMDKIVYVPQFHSFSDQSWCKWFMLVKLSLPKREREKNRSGKMWKSRVNNPKWFLFTARSEWEREKKKSENKV